MDKIHTELVHEARLAVKCVAQLVTKLRETIRTSGNSEAISNVILSYRHLEDASMRLEKAVQALDGGVSVYDNSTI